MSKKPEKPKKDEKATPRKPKPKPKPSPTGKDEEE